MGRGKRSAGSGSVRGLVVARADDDMIIGLSERGAVRGSVLPPQLVKSFAENPMPLPPADPISSPSGRSLSGRVVVPTGGISGITRADVIPMLEEAGASAYNDAKFITPSTVVLVSGVQAKKWQAQDPKMSSKLKKAQQVGATVVIVQDANDFRDILSGRRPV